MIFFLGLVFEIHFRERAFVLVVLLLPCVFRCCFAYVFYLFVGLLIRKFVAKILFILGLVCEIHFRARVFCFCCLVAF